MLPPASEKKVIFKGSVFSIQDAERLYRSHIADAKILDIDKPEEFKLNVTNLDLENCSVVESNFNRKCRMEASLGSDDFKFVIGGEQRTLFRTDGQGYIVSGTDGIILCPNIIANVEREAQSRTIVVNTSFSTLVTHYETTIDNALSKPLRFPHKLDLAVEPGRFLRWFLVDFTSGKFDSEQILSVTGILRGIEEIILNSLLALSDQSKVYGEPSSITRIHCGKIVHRAEEYMSAHFRQSIQISDLLRVCGCSRKVLFESFRSLRDCTPMDFLKDYRLQNARSLLIHTRKGERSVSEIAFCCGFSHLGRFSQKYKRHFSELPSDTLSKR